MKILITGSSGQIGTNLGLGLLDDGHAVVGVDKRPNPWTERIPTIVQDLDQPISSLAGSGMQVTYPNDLDVVVHLAANAKVHELVEDPRRALENIRTTFNVLEFCRRYDLPLVFSSSREVYGDVHRYLTEEPHADFAFTESPYSASKIAGEAFIYSYTRCYDLRYIVFRFSNVYGRYDNDLDRMERVLPLFTRKIHNGEPITVYGGDKTLDFTYVDDCVRGIRRGIDLLASGERANHTINLAYGEGNTLVAAAGYIAETIGVIPTINIEPARPGEVTYYVADISAAQRLLGYTPSVPLSEGIPRAVEWALDWWSTYDLSFRERRASSSGRL